MLDKPDQHLTAHHEAGHALVAYIRQVPMTSVSTKSTGHSYGRVAMRRYSEFSSGQFRAVSPANRIDVSLAGMIALECIGVERWEQGGDKDWEEVQGCLVEMGLSGEAAEECLHQRFAEVKRLICLHQRTLSDIAEELILSRSLRVSSIRRICRKGNVGVEPGVDDT